MNKIGQTSRLQKLVIGMSVGFVVFGLSGCGKKIKLKGAKAIQTMVEATVTTTSSGIVEAKQAAVLGFSAPGRVSKVQVKLGSRVKQGQLLAQIENTDLQTMANDSAREFDRAKQLKAQSLISDVAFDDAARAMQLAKSNLEKAQIKAPFDGIVTELNLEIGELAGSNALKAPLRLVDEKPRTIKGEIDELDLSKVKVGCAARVRISAIRPEIFDAKVIQVIPFISTAKEKDRTVQIELEITEKSLGDLKPSQIPVGASADVEMVIESKKALAVPTKVLMGSANNKAARTLFVAVDGKLQKRTVKTGLGNYDKTEILEGISEGEFIVFPPDDMEIKEGMKVETESVVWP